MFPEESCSLRLAARLALGQSLSSGENSKRQPTHQHPDCFLSFPPIPPLPLECTIPLPLFSSCLNSVQVSYLTPFHSIFLSDLNLGGQLPVQKLNSQMGLLCASDTAVLVGSLLSAALLFCILPPAVCDWWPLPSAIEENPLSCLHWLVPGFMPRYSGQ